MKSDVEINAALQVLEAIDVEGSDVNITTAKSVLEWVLGDSSLTSLKGVLDNEMPSL